jgi:Mg2+-importing ATPase
VDVAKEAADLVMLERGLMVLVAGIKEGRKVFANTLKYIYMATSANFGNMFSMMGASLFPVSMMPFLPLLPKQILLMNVLTDLPEMAIATDKVDPELIAKPRRLDTSALKRFMLLYGSLSSLFDFATFGMLLWLKESERMFQTGWFTESIISASLIVLVIRTRRPFLYSHPSRYLVAATAGVIFTTLIVPYTSIGALLNLEPLSGSILVGVGGIVMLYVAAAECMKLYVSRHTLWM